MVINTYPNISSNDYRLTRTAFRNLQTKGAFHIEDKQYDYKSTGILVSRLDRVVYARDLERERRVLEGKLVETFSKEKREEIKKNLAVKEIKDDGEQKKGAKKKSEERKRPPADKILLERVIFYHLFIQPIRPILLCEGSLDHFHIRRARKITNYVFSGSPEKNSVYNRMRLSSLS